ncbi:MAG: GIY-YIG nuclease family protein [Deltaproteobacteria bacterium]|nr:GIY-YIG nuclease family protein [Deltaproteobacteria bacterium]MBW1816035.1 GIY-YIG nuclease family protein [Deltaproteobacteria bacterium]
MNGSHYVYILVSETDSSLHYTGLTNNLESRIYLKNSRQKLSIISSSVHLFNFSV